MTLSRSFALLLCVLFTSANGLQAVPHISKTQPVSAVTLQPLSSDDTHFSFQFQLDEVTIQEVEVEGYTLGRYGFQGAIYAEEPEQPMLPYKRIKIAIPPDATVSVNTSILSASSQAGPAPVSAPRIEPQPDGTFREIWQANPTQATRQTDLPVARISEPGMFRYQRFVNVDIFPVQYEGNGQVQVITSARVTVQWQTPNAARTYRPAPMDPLAHKLYNRLFLNSEQAAHWRFVPGTADQTNLEFNERQDEIIFDRSGQWVKIKIADVYDDDNHRYEDRNGIYRITGDELADAGVNLSQIDLGSIRLFGNGSRELPADFDDPRQYYREVPLRTSRASGTFATDDFFLFYGLSQTGFEDEFGLDSAVDFYENPYADVNYYWLTWGGNFDTNPLRIQTRSQSTFANPLSKTSFAETFHMEDNVDWLNFGGFRLSDDDWVWDFLVGRGTPGGDNYYYNFDLPDKSPQSGQTTVGIAFQEKTASGTADFYLNGELVGSHNWLQGGAAYTEMFEGNWAIDGENQFQVRLNGPSANNPDQVYLGWFYVTYQRQLRARDNHLKFRSDLDETAQGARYTVSNFNNNSISVWDVSNPFNPTAIQYDLAGSGTISFQDSTFATDRKIYVSATADGFLSVDAIELASFEQPFLHDPTNQADYLIVAPNMFHDELEPLISLRRESLLTAYEETPTPIADPQIKLVDTDQVYAEFSGGYIDPAGMRDFLKYAYENWSRPPLYVLFVSDANRDYRNYRQDDDPVINYVPTRQVPGNYIWATDDWLVWLNEGRQVDMINGRLPVENESQAEIVVNKIVEYETNPAYGAWRNRIIAVADDYFQPSGDSPQQIYFTTVEDGIPVPNHFDLTEIFLVEYPFDPDGNTKSLARQDFLEAINQGAVSIRYTGHGGPPKMADENVFNITDVPGLSNGQRLAMWSAWSCDLANFDDYARECIAEDLLIAPDKGSIASIAGIRSTYGGPNRSLEEQFMFHLFDHSQISMGEALALGKMDVGNEQNSSKYIMMGDPAQQLGGPRLNVQLDDDLTIEQAHTVTVSGGIYEGNNLRSDFNGYAFITIFSNRDVVNYYDPTYNLAREWDHHGTPIFRGTTQVTNGQFSQTAFIPSNVELGDDGRVSIYAWDDNLMVDGAGAQDSIGIVSGTTPSDDTSGPTIRSRLDGNLLLQSGVIYPGSTLEVELSDDSGINLAGTSEAGILFDLIQPRSNPDDPVITVYQSDLTPYFEYNMGDYQSGELSWQIPNLDEGQYTLRLRAIDNLNNANTVSYNIEVRESTTQSQLSVVEIFNYPNPAETETDFLFKVNRDNALATIKIYTVAGRLIQTLGPEPTVALPNQSRIRWDGRDADGDQVANGVYLYKLTVEYMHENGTDRRSYYGKMMFHR